MSEASIIILKNDLHPKFFAKVFERSVCRLSGHDAELLHFVVAVLNGTDLPVCASSETKSLNPKGAF